MSDWFSKGCDSCQQAALRGGDDQEIPVIAENIALHARLRRCIVCDALWEESEREMHFIEESQARQIFPDFFISKPYEILPGLPPYGPSAQAFSATGQGTHREGFVVRFFPRDGESWVGNFISYDHGAQGVYNHPDGTRVIVVARGQGYVVDIQTRQCIHVLHGQIQVILPISHMKMLIVGDGLGFQAIDSNGIRWQTRRISWDGMQNIQISGATLSGNAYDPLNDGWEPFTLDLESGLVTGGSYCDPFTH